MGVPSAMSSRRCGISLNRPNSTAEKGSRGTSTAAIIPSPQEFSGRLSPWQRLLRRNSVPCTSSFIAQEASMDRTAETIPSANSTGAPYIAGNFGPLRTEVTAFDLEVIGRVPEELSGRFLRIGPNPADEPDLVRLVRYHWFAGTGMVHGVRLRGGRAEWFRSRFVIDRDAAKVLNRS